MILRPNFLSMFAPIFYLRSSYTVTNYGTNFNLMFNTQFGAGNLWVHKNIRHILYTNFVILDLFPHGLRVGMRMQRLNVTGTHCIEFACSPRALGESLES